MDERVEKAVRNTAALLERLGHELVEHTPRYPLLLPLASITGILPGMAPDTAGLPHRSLERVHDAAVHGIPRRPHQPGDGLGEIP